MKKGLTELAFLLDRSGSMSGLESDTIGGYNGLIEKQRKEPGEATVTTVLFDDRYELLHDRCALAGVSPITEKEYYVRGNTALFDAVGQTIAKLDNAISHTAESERPERVMVVITTDGMENASREFSAAQVKSMIEAHKEKGWEFLFLGANIDAVATAARFGIARDRAVRYCADGAGTQLNYQAVDAAITSFREARPLAANWKQAIEQDYQTRGK